MARLNKQDANLADQIARTIALQRKSEARLTRKAIQWDTAEILDEHGLSDVNNTDTFWNRIERKARGLHQMYRELAWS